MKYIDAEKLITEIERELSAHDKVDHLEAFEVGKAWNRGHVRALEEVLDFITSLQQEPQYCVAVPKWCLESIENTLRIQHNFNLEKTTGETCQDRNIRCSLNQLRKLLDGEELTGMERLEPLKEQPEVESGVGLIAEERKRQIQVEGRTKEHDAEHTDESLALAAVCYAIPSVQRAYTYDPILKARIPVFWPWDIQWWKPSPENRVKELIKAGALIAAEIDRLNARKEE